MTLGRAIDQFCKLFGENLYVVYIPTAPVPMSGGIFFVPADDVQPIDMAVEDLIQICVSLGVMTPTVMPAQYRAGQHAEELNPDIVSPPNPESD